MVGSVLGSSATSHLLSLVDYGVDLDGSLLITKASSLFTGGVEWGKIEGYSFGSIGWTTDVVGVGVLKK